jgi:hypothetical protein
MTQNTPPSAPAENPSADELVIKLVELIPQLPQGSMLTTTPQGKTLQILNPKMSSDPNPFRIPTMYRIAIANQDECLFTIIFVTPSQFSTPGSIEIHTGKQPMGKASLPIVKAELQRGFKPEDPLRLTNHSFQQFQMTLRGMNALIAILEKCIEEAKVKQIARSTEQPDARQIVVTDIQRRVEELL